MRIIYIAIMSTCMEWHPWPSKKFLTAQNPLYEMPDKVEHIVNLAFYNPKFLRNKDQFGLNIGVDTWLYIHCASKGFSVISIQLLVISNQ